VSVTATETSVGETTASTTSVEESSSGGTPECGDGMKNGEELCDGNDLGGNTCETFNLGGGTLLCTPNCMNWNFAMCDTGAICGNDVVEGPEHCDGMDLNGNTCLDHPMYADGTLACVECELDYSGCTPCVANAGACDSNEQCCSESCDALGLGLCL
jgi:hypothetical protein